jgi:hypothetical protein
MLPSVPASVTLPLPSRMLSRNPRTGTVGELNLVGIASRPCKFAQIHQPVSVGHP